MFYLLKNFIIAFVVVAMTSILSYQLLIQTIQEFAGGYHPVGMKVVLSYAEKFAPFALGISLLLAIVFSVESDRVRKDK